MGSNPGKGKYLPVTIKRIKPLHYPLFRFELLRDIDCSVEVSVDRSRVGHGDGLWCIWVLDMELADNVLGMVADIA